MLDKAGLIPALSFKLDLIQKKIEDGTYPENTAIPSERALCDMYDVSRITVRQRLILRPLKGSWLRDRVKVPM